MKHPACSKCGKPLYKTQAKGLNALVGSDYVYCRNKACENSIFYKNKKQKVKKKKIEKEQKETLLKEKAKKQKSKKKKGRAEKKRDRAKALIERQKNPVVEAARARLKTFLGDFESNSLMALIISLLAETLGEQEIVYFLVKKYNLEELYHFKLS